jgi:hypothetical protein
MTLQAAIKTMPKALVGSFDPLTHTSVASLARLAAHELDLYTEQQETDITSPRQAKAVHRYLIALSKEISK